MEEKIVMSDVMLYGGGNYHHIFFTTQIFILIFIHKEKKRSIISGNNVLWWTFGDVDKGAKMKLAFFCLTHSSSISSPLIQIISRKL